MFSTAITSSLSHFIAFIGVIYIIDLPLFCLTMLMRSFADDHTGGCTGCLRKVPCCRTKSRLVIIDVSARVKSSKPAKRMEATRETEHFGFLFQDLSWDHAAFRITFFLLNICTGVEGELIPLRDASLKLLLLGIIFTAECLLIVLHLPFTSWKMNVLTAVAFAIEIVSSLQTASVLRMCDQLLTLMIQSLIYSWCWSVL
jgi:hypothetical protein